MTHRSCRNLVLSVFFLATLAKADAITQFTGIYTLDFALDVAGIDGQGDSVDFGTGTVYTGGGPCPCFGGQAFNVQLDTGGFIPATVNGVRYYGTETISLSITGVLPPITMPAGWQGVVTFPITLDVSVIYYHNNPNPNDVLFTLSASGMGTASAYLSILDEANGEPTYQNLGGITFASDVPEAPSGWLAGLGLALFAVLRRANKGMRLI